MVSAFVSGLNCQGLGLGLGLGFWAFVLGQDTTTLIRVHVVPLSTQVHEWVLANLICSGLASHPGEVASCYRNQDMLWPDGPLGSYVHFTLL